MAYRLSIADELPGSVRACARDQLAGAADQLARPDADPIDAVHAARKHLKKTRALLRLVRPDLPKRAYREENATLRELARELSGTRDADALVETAVALAERFAGQLPAETFAELGELLAAEAAASRPAGDADRARLIEALRAAAARVDAWPLERCDWDTPVAGAARAYARGREAFAGARADPTTEQLHAWRKRAKDLWYHQRLLQPAWPLVLDAQADAAHELTELLGDDHDLAVLTARLDDAEPLTPVVDADRGALLALVEERREELRAAAARLGRRIYAESPSAFRRRLGRYVREAVAEQHGR